MHINEDNMDGKSWIVLIVLAMFISVIVSFRTDILLFIWHGTFEAVLCEMLRPEILNIECKR